MTITLDEIKTFSNENEEQLKKAINEAIDEAQGNTDVEGISVVAYSKWQKIIYEHFSKPNEPLDKPIKINKLVLNNDIDKISKQINLKDKMTKLIEEELAHRAKQAPLATEPPESVASAEPNVPPESLIPATEEPNDLNKAHAFIHDLKNIEQAVQKVVDLKPSRTWTDTNTEHAVMLLKHSIDGNQIVISNSHLASLIDQKIRDQIKKMGQERSNMLSDLEINKRQKAKEQAAKDIALQKIYQERARLDLAPPLPDIPEEDENDNESDDENIDVSSLRREQEAILDITAQVSAIQAAHSRKGQSNRSMRSAADEDVDLARALSLSLEDKTKHTQEEELQRALELSKKEQENKAAQNQPPAPLKFAKPVSDLVPPPASSVENQEPTPLTPPTAPTPVIQVSLAAQKTYPTLKKYIQKRTDEQTKNALHSGTFYGRSDQFKKLEVAKLAFSTLESTEILPQDKLTAIYKLIKENRTYTGHAFLHQHKGDLSSILEAAKTDLITQLQAEPYKVVFAELNAYKQEAVKARKQKTLNDGISIGSFVIKSNQVKKLEIAEKAMTYRDQLQATGIDANRLNSLVVWQKELTNLIEENTKLTSGSNILHSKGQLHSILENLRNEVNSEIARLTPANKP